MINLDMIQVEQLSEVCRNEVYEKFADKYGEDLLYIKKRKIDEMDLSELNNHIDVGSLSFIHHN